MEKYDLTPQQEEEMIDKAYQNLLNGYLASNHRKKVEIIERAFKFAKSAHAGIRRRSGEPYIMHPIEVARIVSQEIGLGSTSICSALLHDVVEDTEYTVEDIEAQFGKKIAEITQGLTKISGGIFGDKASAQAENFRKLLLTMSSDIRVVLIKMADRLHNMRTLGSMLPSKQYKIAGETLYIYAPLAHRLGLFAIKTELEDLSFKYEHPDVYKQIAQKIADSEQSRNEFFERFSAPIRERLSRMGLKYEMRARVKSVYSIWNKMETKRVPFEEVYDLYAARIVFDCPKDAEEKHICWNIYSEITDLYRLHPERTRDWISTPKANGYRALHLTVMGPDGNWVEVQIRSRRMDELAERGFAAHWKYKVGEGEEEKELGKWLQTIEDILKSPEPNALDFLDTIKLNLFSSEIVVFTPKGELVTLPNGASVLDLAYTLHSDLGNHCIAGKVNHKLVPLSHKLNSGDQAEVLTSQSQQPQPEWEAFLATAKGKQRLRAALRRDHRHITAEGEALLKSFLEDNGLTYSNETLTKIVANLELRNSNELCFMVGNNELALNDQILKYAKKSNNGLFSKIFRIGSKQKEENNVIKFEGNIDQKVVYQLTNNNGVRNYTTADCCHPIPGDDVVGFVNQNSIVEVHKLTCPEMMRLKSSYGSRLLQTKWEDYSTKFLASVEVTGIDRMGILQEIVYLISTTLAINLRRLNIAANDGVFKCELDVLVSDTKVVDQLCRRMRQVQGVKNALRLNK